MAAHSSILAWEMSHGQRGLVGYGTWGCKSQTRLSDRTHTQTVYFSNLIDEKCLSSILVSIHLNLRIFFFFAVSVSFGCDWSAHVLGSFV